jgi:Mn2+/Fe2+ NRAMP family transporter
VAAALVLIPGAPLVKILFLTQALNAILLLAILPFLRGLARDPDVMGEHRLSRLDSVATAAVIVLVGLSVVLLGVLSVVG